MLEIFVRRMKYAGLAGFIAVVGYQVFLRPSEEVLSGKAALTWLLALAVIASIHEMQKAAAIRKDVVRLLAWVGWGSSIVFYISAYVIAMHEFS